MAVSKLESLLRTAEKGIKDYLEAARQQGRIDVQSDGQAVNNTLPNLRQWLGDPHIDRISPNLKEGVRQAIDAGAGRTSSTPIARRCASAPAASAA